MIAINPVVVMTAVALETEILKKEGDSEEEEEEDKKEKEEEDQEGDPASIYSRRVYR